MIPLNPLDRPPIDLVNRWHAALEGALVRGRFIGGDVVSQFEQSFATTVGVSHCIGTGNGLDALTLGLTALNFPLGSPIAVPAHTFVATPLAVVRAGHIPVFVDTDARGQIDLQGLEELRQPIIAVIAVHMHGASTDMDRLLHWCNSKGVVLIEDCAQSAGAFWKRRPLGSYGRFSAFSFYPTKNLGALGDGGAICTSDATLAERSQKLANYGYAQNHRQTIDLSGINSRLDALQAGFLQASLPHLHDWNEERQRQAARYLASLGPSTRVKPLITGAADSTWHHFVILSDERGQTEKKLADMQIETKRYYPQSAAWVFGERGLNDRFPNAETIARHATGIPIHPWLTSDEVEAVSGALRDL